MLQRSHGRIGTIGSVNVIANARGTRCDVTLVTLCFVPDGGRSFAFLRRTQTKVSPEAADWCRI
jgi:hypothetical protein